MSKKTIQITITEKRVVEREIDFPIFRKHGGLDHGEEYTRIDENLSAAKIGKHDEDSISNEFVERYNFLDFSSPDYHLGDGVHRCSKEEYETVLNGVKNRIAKLLA